MEPVGIPGRINALLLAIRGRTGPVTLHDVQKPVTRIVVRTEVDNLATGGRIQRELATVGAFGGDEQLLGSIRVIELDKWRVAIGVHAQLENPVALGIHELRVRIPGVGYVFR